MERWLSWPKAHDWKSCNGLNPFEGSNPSLSATVVKPRSVTLRGFFRAIDGADKPEYNSGEQNGHPLF